MATEAEREQHMAFRRQAETAKPAYVAQAEASADARDFNIRQMALAQTVALFKECPGEFKVEDIERTLRLFHSFLMER